MVVIPAIDLSKGNCVRLRQGRMEDSEIFSDDPLDVAKRWRESGARRIHIIDLDGAMEGSPKHSEIVNRISSQYPDIEIEVGGGIRTEEAVREYIDNGARWVILGTIAVRDPDLVERICSIYPDRIIIGLDARKQLISTEGWKKQEELSVSSLISRFENCSVAAFIYTDISRDGMLSGVNIEDTVALAKSTSAPVIASGGVSNLQDIIELRSYDDFIHGVVVGRALYSGDLLLKEALDATA